MKCTVEAIYENGVLRPVTLLCPLQEGQRVRLTVEPIVKLAPAEEERLEEEFFRQLEAEGFLERYPVSQEPPPKDWKPLVVEGEPLSETIILLRGGRE